MVLETGATTPKPKATGLDLVREMFLDAPIGPTDERGHRKICPTCMDWTGHIILPTPAWQIQRCTRCGRSKILKVIVPRHVRSQRALMADPDLTSAALFDYACRIFGLPFVVRAVEIRFQRDVKERQRDIIKRIRDRLVGERKQLANLSRL